MEELEKFCRWHYEQGIRMSRLAYIFGSLMLIMSTQGLMPYRLIIGACGIVVIASGLHMRNTAHRIIRLYLQLEADIAEAKRQNKLKALRGED
jgi:hypothetical protein